MTKASAVSTSTAALNGQQRTITTTPAGKKADTSRQPATGMYRAIPHIWFQHPVDLPPFTFTTIRAMLMDEGIRLNFETRSAPIHSVEFGWEEEGQWHEGVKCRDAAVAQFIYRQLQRIWKTYLPEILRAQIWGWSAGEVTLKLSEETGLVEINELLPRHPMDCKLLKIGCERWGVQINRVEGGTINLPFPYAWFHSYGAEDGEDYGTSAAYGAYSSWADKWFDGGAKEVRRLFMHKDAYGGVDLGYPDGETYIQGYDTPIPNRDIARQIAESIRAGGVTVRPSETDEHGNEKWPLKRATVASNPQHILQYPKDLDEEIRHGMGIPDDVINSGTTGSWNGKAIPMQSFYAGLDGWVIRILKDVCTQIIDHLLILNYGRKVEYETPFKSLAKQAMEQQNEGENSNGNNNGMPQDSPNSRPFNAQQQQQQADPTGEVDKPITLSVIDRVGSGELNVDSILSAGRKAVESVVKQNLTTEDEPKEPHKFSSTQFNLPDAAANLVRSMAARIPDDALAEDGREDQPHITIKYGLHDDTPDGVLKAVEGFEPVRVVLGKASIFEKSNEYDVLKIDVDSDQLRALNELIADSIEHTDTHPTYQPHVTIAYVKPGLGAGLAAMLNDAEGTEIVFDSLVFSAKDRTHTVIDLAKPEPVVELEPDAERLFEKFSRYFRKLVGLPQRMSADDKAGRMLTGKFAGQTMEEAFNKGGAADKAKTPEQSPANQKREDGTPAAPIREDVYTVPTNTLKVDPERFQYKVKGIGAQGVGDELKGTSSWNPELGGTLLVWRDPADGKDYVVNGHHRHELATRVGAEKINARYIDAPTPKHARAIGALANIAEGRGSAIDAAKYLRDSGQDVDHMRRAGISMSGKVASDASNLIKLSDKSFAAVARGDLDEDKAAAVAKHLESQELQDKLFKKLEKREDDGKDWSTREVEAAAKKMARAGKVTQSTTDLFGDWESEESTFDQEVEIESFINRALATEANDFAAVSSTRRAERVSETGNVINIDANLQKRDSARSALSDFDRESGLKGPISEAVKAQAARLAKATKKSERELIKKDTLEEIRKLLLQSN